MAEQLLFLDREAVLASLAHVDACEEVAQVLCRHAEGRVELPAEGYLPWANGEGAYCRSLAMLGAVEVDGGSPLRGMKLINAATSNPSHGRERAAGLIMLFDPDTARPHVLAEAGWLSATRTAAYTMVSLRHLGPERWDATTFLGCGMLARVHVGLLATAFPRMTRVHLYDTEPRRAEELAGWIRERHPHFTVRVEPGARPAVAAAQVVVTTTTADRGYLPAAWLAPGTFVAHVSLADLLPDAFLEAQGVFVDDVALVADNPRRILGRLMRESRITALSGTLGQVLIGERPPVRPTASHVISNPFGMAVLDVGLLGAVHEAAVRLGLGQKLTLY
ncbi:ornithine cyclodeaminase [Streptomyces sp. WAC 01529]|uniref:ornithine cyclodeaminase n=1 Tax=Streptomyces sp. WAC 01529 TaxID=2203205 RepID=UPI000F6FA0FD|nr:ornithine cyclodeaminase [Streptomyces sp. WAC 01529]AZM51938.1 ornithine cyclodeaminase [Streptomyces sp. WAC 01529]